MPLAYQVTLAQILGVGTQPQSAAFVTVVKPGFTEASYKGISTLIAVSLIFSFLLRKTVNKSCKRNTLYLFLQCLICDE